MSGYPYDNSGAGGYPPQYGAPNNSYPNYPPPPNNYNDNQSCASLYGTPAPMANNYPPAPYDAYGGNQMNNAPYGMGAGNNYPMAPPPMSQPMYNPPPQPYGGYGNQPGGMPSNYPPAPNYGVSSELFSSLSNVTDHLGRRHGSTLWRSYASAAARIHATRAILDGLRKLGTIPRNGLSHAELQSRC